MRQAFYGRSPLTDSEPAVGCAKSRGSEAVTGHGARPSPHRVIIAQLQCMLALGHANTATHFYKKPGDCR
jgi:hypothetical protein